MRLNARSTMLSALYETSFETTESCTDNRKRKNLAKTAKRRARHTSSIPPQNRRRTSTRTRNRAQEEAIHKIPPRHQQRRFNRRRIPRPFSKTTKTNDLKPRRFPHQRRRCGSRMGRMDAKKQNMGRRHQRNSNSRAGFKDTRPIHIHRVQKRQKVQSEARGCPQEMSAENAGILREPFVSITTMIPHLHIHSTEFGSLFSSFPVFIKVGDGWGIRRFTNNFTDVCFLV